METKTLLAGLTGFFIGGFIVSVAATTFEKPEASSSDKAMSEVRASLQNKTGDEFDKAFLQEMISHHEGAIEMAKLAGANAKHEEIKKLSKDIMSAQSREIDIMQTWQTDWGYKNTPKSHSSH